MRLFYALAGSALLHFLVFSWNIPRKPDVPPEAPIELVIIDPAVPEKSSETKVVIRDTEIPEDQLRERITNDESRFLSANTQRVQKEMKAKEIGKTKNRLNLAFPVSKPTPVDTQSNELTEIGEGPGKKPTPQSAAPSTVGHELPDDIEIGGFTVLNADRITYYSFFHRVEDLIRFRWETNVRRQIAALSGRALRLPKRDRWPTQVRVVLDAGGKILSISLISGSGISGFDSAAGSAFQETGMLPNPPAELRRPDGTIVLDYGFTVLWRPTFLAQDR